MTPAKPPASSPSWTLSPTHTHAPFVRRRLQSRVLRRRKERRFRSARLFSVIPLASFHQPFPMEERVRIPTRSGFEVGFLLPNLCFVTHWEFSLFCTFNKTLDPRCNYNWFKRETLKKGKEYKTSVRCSPILQEGRFSCR